MGRIPSDLLVPERIGDRAIARFSYWGDGSPAIETEEPETVTVEVPRGADRVILERK